MSLLFLAAAMASSAVHSETITYREQPIDLHYSASVVITRSPKGSCSLERHGAQLSLERQAYY
jgi:hypothetical protein